MAPRIGFTLDALRDMHPGACADDVRLVWRDGDCFNVGIVQPRLRQESPIYFLNLCIGSSRELRLLGHQMIEHADNLERSSERIEVVIP